MLAQENVVKVVAELGTCDRTIFVLNRVDGRAPSMARETLLKLGAMIPESPVRPVEVHQRTDFAKASATGRTGAEPNAEARGEIQTLWKAIRKVLDGQEARHGHNTAKLEAEARALDGVEKTDARHRRKLGKTTQIIFRVRPEKKQQLVRLAEVLSAGKAVPVSLTETMEQAIDALEARLRGKSH